MSSLPAPNIIYNGFRFPAETVTTGLNVTPVPDGSGRTFAYNRYVFTIRTILSGTTIDARVRAIVRQLTAPAAPFIYSGTGLGVGVNIGSIRDAVWGPTPLSCDVKPLGGGNTVELVWKVEVHIPDSATATYAFAPMEFNYALTFSEDRSGYTTRRYSGYVRIPMTRPTTGNRNIIDNVDGYREEITPLCPINFRRVSQEFTVSPDKCRLDFSIVDEEMPKPLPPGIVDASASHQIASTPGKWFEWNCTLNAEYELARGSGSNFSTARAAFFDLLKQHVNVTLTAIGTPAPGAPRGRPPEGGGQLENKTPQKAVIPVSFSMSDPEIYGRDKVGFSCTYRVTGLSLKDMLQYGGQFQPIPNTNWAVWSQSMNNTLGPRGTAGLVVSPADDGIVDLFSPSIIKTPLPRVAGWGNSLQNIPAGIFPPPTQDTSWLAWENSLHIEPDHSVVPIVTLPNGRKAREMATGGINAILGGVGSAISPAQAGLDSVTGGVLGGIPNPPTGSLPRVPPPYWLPSMKLPRAGDFIKTVAASGAMVPNGGGVQQLKQSCWITMTGKAARVGFPIPCPYLVKWGPATLKPACRPDKGEGFFAQVVGDVGWPVFGARWTLRYWCSEIPPGFDLPVPQQPMSSGPGLGAVVGGFAG